MGFFDKLLTAVDILEGVASQSMDRANGSLARKEDYVKNAERSGKITSQQANKALHSINEARGNINSTQSFHRRSDDELNQDKTGMDKKPTDFSYKNGVLLSNAKSCAPSEPGVYILRLNGTVMKCGRASYGGGVRWRFTQYYNLNYDNKSRDGDYWSVNKENRDRITVSWQCCPPSQCHELEYKLFKKYGKGKWADRAPASCSTNNWKLLI